MTRAGRLAGLHKSAASVKWGGLCDSPEAEQYSQVITVINHRPTFTRWLLSSQPYDVYVGDRHAANILQVDVAAQLSDVLACICLFSSCFSDGKVSSYTKAYCFLNWSVLNLPLKLSNLGSLLALQHRTQLTTALAIFQQNASAVGTHGLDVSMTCLCRGTGLLLVCSTGLFLFSRLKVRVVQLLGCACILPPLAAAPGTNDPSCCILTKCSKGISAPWTHRAMFMYPA